VFGYRHQLDVSEAHLGAVLGQLVSEVAIVEVLTVTRLPPRAQMHLVHRHRLLVRLRGLAALHPRIVGELVGRGVHDARASERSTGHLGAERHRVGLEDQVPLSRDDLELVEGAVTDIGDEELPDPRRAERAHLVEAPVPTVELAHDAHAARVRRPHGEARAPHSVDRLNAGPELLPQSEVPALAQKVEIQLAQRG
jgi:hypothetical protein